MKRKLAIAAVALCGAFAANATLPSAAVDVGPVEVGVEQAAAQKGGGNLKQSGEKGADLINTIIGPLLIAGCGVIAAVCLVKRDYGWASGAIAIATVAAVFIYAPNTVESLWKDGIQAVF